MDELLPRELTPAVIGVLVYRGVDFATAEDAVREALIQAALTWPERQPADPKGWLVTVAWRKFLDARRCEVSRRDREQRVEAEPPPGPTETADDTLRLLFLCAHPSLTPASAVALTLRAVGGLTTRQIADATWPTDLPPGTRSPAQPRRPDTSPADRPARSSHARTARQLQQVDGALASKAQLQDRIRRNKGQPVPRATAYVELLQAIQVDLEAVRNKKVGDMHVNVSDNMPPGIKADVIHGFHTNPTWNEGLVSWTYLGALMDAKNLSKKNERLATPA